jgi:hypothetical protein
VHKFTADTFEEARGEFDRNGGKLMYSSDEETNRSMSGGEGDEE